VGDLKKADAIVVAEGYATAATAIGVRDVEHGFLAPIIVQGCHPVRTAVHNWMLESLCEDNQLIDHGGLSDGSLFFFTTIMNVPDPTPVFETCWRFAAAAQTAPVQEDSGPPLTRDTVEAIRPLLVKKGSFRRSERGRQVIKRGGTMDRSAA
jgi:hypothetical protein